MPPEVYLVCPRCGHQYNLHARVYERGPDFPMFCPLCNASFPQREGRVASAGEPLTGGDGTARDAADVAPPQAGPGR